jgi:hypothetical protein
MKRSRYITALALAVTAVLAGVLVYYDEPSNMLLPLLAVDGPRDAPRTVDEKQGANGVPPETRVAGEPQAETTDTHVESGRDEPALQWPPNIEADIWAYFSRQPDLALVSIDSVTCTDTECEVVFNGLETDPEYVDKYADLLNKMFEEPWNATQGSLGRKEIAPGAISFVLTISNEPVRLDRRNRH